MASIGAYRKGGNQQQDDKQNLKKHEIYDSTYYISNNKIRVLEIPMSSSLTFQMLLYYHFYYDLLYIVFVFTTQIYKMWVLSTNIIDILALIITLVWFPVEMARLNFAYKGNITETVNSKSLIMTYIVPRADSLFDIHNFLYHSFQCGPLHLAF